MHLHNLPPTTLHGVFYTRAPAAAEPGIRATQHEHHIDNLRGLSILLVVLTHLSTLPLIDTSSNAVGFLVTGATTWFVFISGYLFYRTEHGRFAYSVYLGKKLRSVWSPYLLFMAICVTLGILRSRPAIHDMSVLEYILWSVSVGGELVVPLWFIPTISIFFLISPLVMAVAGQRSFLALTAVLMYVSLFSGRPAFNLNPLLSAVHFAGFYVLGTLCGKHAGTLQQVSRSSAAWAWMLVGLLVFAYGLWLHGSLDLQPQTFQEAWGRPNAVEVSKVGLLMTLFVAFSRWLSRPVPVLAHLAKISFGIYFVHGFVGVGFSYFERIVQMQDSRLVPLVEFAFVLTLSTLIVETIRRATPSKSRYVLGC